MKQDSYSDLTAKVYWNNQISEPFQIHRGTKQGGIASTRDYVTSSNDQLEILNDSKIGFSIGPHYIGAPTVADDTICLATTPYELQLQLDVIAFCANREHYDIHPTKSSISNFNTKYINPAIEEPIPIWTLNDL